MAAELKEQLGMPEKTEQVVLPAVIPPLPQAEQSEIVVTEIQYQGNTYRLVD